MMSCVNASVHRTKRGMSGLSSPDYGSPKTSVDAPKRTAALVLDHANEVAITEEPEV